MIRRTREDPRSVLTFQVTRQPILQVVCVTRARCHENLARNVTQMPRVKYDSIDGLLNLTEGFYWANRTCMPNHLHAVIAITQLAIAPNSRIRARLSNLMYIDTRWWPCTLWLILTTAIEWPLVPIESGQWSRSMIRGRHHRKCLRIRPGDDRCTYPFSPDARISPE